MKHLAAILAKTWILFFLIGFWQFMVTSGFWPASLIASPVSTVQTFFTLIQNGQLWTHILASISRIMIGLSLGSLFGIFFGLIIGSLKDLKFHFDLPISILYAIPPIAWMPFYIIGFGIDETTKILLISFTFFTVISVHTWEGVLQTETQLLHLAHLFEKNYLEKIIHIWIPACTPYILNGLKIATFYAWGILITSEIIASSSGLGYLLWNSRQFSRSDDMMVAIVTIGFLGFLSDFMIAKIQNKLLHWQNKVL